VLPVEAKRAGAPPIGGRERGSTIVGAAILAD
jgi:hypothetical protein